MHRNKILRILLSSLCIAALTGSVNASGPFDAVRGAGDAMKTAYTLITAIALPLAAISVVIGACKFFGLSILSTKSSERQMEAGRRQIVITLVALGCLYLMPAVIRYSYDFVQAYKWKPDTSGEHLSWNGNDFGGSGALDSLVSGNPLISEKNLLPGDGFSVATTNQNKNYNDLMNALENKPNVVLHFTETIQEALTEIIKEDRHDYFCLPRGRTYSTLIKYIYDSIDAYAEIQNESQALAKAKELWDMEEDGKAQRVLLVGAEDYSINTSPMNEFDLVCWSKQNAASRSSSDGKITLQFWYRGGLTPGIGYKTPYIENYGHPSVKSTVNVDLKVDTKIAGNGISLLYPVGEQESRYALWGTPRAERSFQTILEDTCKDYNALNGTAYSVNDFFGYFHNPGKGWSWSESSDSETAANAKEFYRYYVGYPYELIHGGLYSGSDNIANAQSCNTGVINILPQKLAADCKAAGEPAYTYEEIVYRNSLAKDFTDTYGKSYSGKYYLVVVRIKTAGNADYEAPAAEATIRLWIPVDWAE